MIYFDMDGVLAQYKYIAYLGENPIWLRKEEHYFLNIEPYEQVLDTFKKLIKIIPEDVYVYTSVYGGDIEIRNVQIHDKMMWLEKYIPEFDIGAHCIANSTGRDKRDNITAIRGMSLTKRDILIDDYNPNLFRWTMSGGKAIKCLNGINSLETWNGDYTYVSKEVADSFEDLDWESSYHDICSLLSKK